MNKNQTLQLIIRQTGKYLIIIFGYMFLGGIAIFILRGNNRALVYVMQGLFIACVWLFSSILVGFYSKRPKIVYILSSVIIISANLYYLESVYIMDLNDCLFIVTGFLFSLFGFISFFQKYRSQLRYCRKLNIASRCVNVENRSWNLDVPIMYDYQKNDDQKQHIRKKIGGRLLSYLVGVPFAYYFGQKFGIELLPVLVLIIIYGMQDLAAKELAVVFEILEIERTHNIKLHLIE